MKKFIEKYHMFNDVVGNAIGNALASMEMTWIVLIVILIPLMMGAHPVGFLAWQQFIVQTFYQGVTLSIIAYVAKLAGDKTESKINKILDTVIKILKEVHGMLKEMHEMVKEIHHEHVVKKRLKPKQK